MTVDQKILDEYSRMVNDLVVARRELSRLNARLAERERFFERVLTLSPLLVFVISLPEGTIEYSSRPIGVLLGDPDLAADGTHAFPGRLASSDDRARYREFIAMLSGSGEDGVHDFEMPLATRDGPERWFLLRHAVFALDPSGTAVRAVVSMEDVTDRKKRESRLKEISQKDPLTGLLNRRGFLDTAESCLSDCEASSQLCALIFMDLDEFKAINDSFGHAEGDKALRAAAESLVSCFRSSDVLARFGGDEFVAMVQVADSSKLDALVERIGACIQRDEHKESPWRLSFSIGTALSEPSAPRTLENLLREADRAMYESKSSKRLVSPEAPTNAARSRSCR